MSDSTGPPGDPQLAEIIVKLAAIHAAMTAKGLGTAPIPAPTPAPDYLMNWREIVTAIGRKDCKRDRRLVAAANKRYNGPLIFPEAGGQPKVRRDVFVAWWASLETVWHERQQQRRDTKATVEDQYAHGRDEIVVPDIGGHVR
jgi:hypothetical protein